MNDFTYDQLILILECIKTSSSICINTEAFNKAVKLSEIENILLRKIRLLEGN